MISIVIPCRMPINMEVTAESLKRQTFTDFEVIATADCGRGANWARNEGAKKAQGEYLLFSDDDIDWEPDALETLFSSLQAHPEASYSYGSYEMDGRIQCAREFDAEQLKKHNYVSTMSLIRRADFPGFDESVTRLMDWDLWLTMLEAGKIGVYCGKLIFHTQLRNGITYGSRLTYPEAWAIIRHKHGLPNGDQVV